MSDDGEVRGIDEGDDEWDGGVASIVLRIGKNDQFRSTECVF